MYWHITRGDLAPPLNSLPQGGFPKKNDCRIIKLLYSLIHILKTIKIISLKCLRKTYLVYIKIVAPPPKCSIHIRL